MAVFKLDHATAVDADKVIVRGLVVEVGIVGGLIFTEVDFAEQVGLDQQAQGAVNGRPRSFGIDFAHAVEEFVRSEMLVLGERRLDDGVTLAGAAQTLATDEFIEFFLDSGFHTTPLPAGVLDGKPKREPVQSPATAPTPPPFALVKRVSPLYAS